MPTYYVAPTPTGSSGNSGTSAGSPWTAKHAAANWSPGDTVKFLPGTYDSTTHDLVDGDANTVVNGSAGNYVLLEANDTEDVPDILTEWDLEGVSYLEIKDMYFESNSGQSWINDSTSTAAFCHHVKLTNLVFSGNKLAARDDYSNVDGLILTGGHHIQIDNCRILTWYPFDGFSFRDVDELLIKNCPFIQAKCGHSILEIERCSDVKVKDCIFNNPWDRAVTMNDDSPPSQNQRVCFEGCLFIRNDWDQSISHPYEGWDDDGEDLTDEAGAGENVRFHANGAIFRNCIVVGANPGQINLEKAAVAFTIFSSNRTYTKMRFYNLVVADCDHRGFYFEDDGDETGVDTRWNKWRNVSVSNCQRQPGAGQGGDGAAEFRVKHGDVDWDDGTAPWEIKNCNFWHTKSGDDVIDLVGESPSEMTASEANSNHAEFSDNVQFAPSFEDTTLLSRFDADPSLFDFGLLAEAFAAYTLKEGTDLKGAGIALTETSSSGSSTTTIPVNDARWFFAGVDEFETGDSVIVGSNDPVTITSISFGSGLPETGATLTVDTPITFGSADPIYLEGMGTSPSIGIFQVAEEDIPEEEPPDDPDPPSSPPITTPGQVSPPGFGRTMPIRDTNTAIELDRLYQYLQRIKFDERVINSLRLGQALGRVLRDGDLLALERVVTGTRPIRAIRLTEETTDPPNPRTNEALLYLTDNGAGKTQLKILYGTGSPVVLDTEA